MKSTPERQHEFDIAYMNMAIAISKLSYAYKKQVGSIVVSKNDQLISQGFNGTPCGLPNICEDVLFEDGHIESHDDDMNYVKTEYRKINAGEYVGMKLKTKPLVLHAETNAITKCAKYNSSTDGGTVYVTLSPCINCAKLIIQANIKRVVYLEDYRHDDGSIALMRSCGIIVEKIDINQ